MSLERQIEEQLVDKLQSLKYEYRQDIRDRDGLVKNFREKFQALNRVQLGDVEFERLLEEIVTPDVFAAAKILRERNSFTRDDGTPLNYTLVNIKDWCKNTLKSSTNSASTPTTATSVTMSSCSSTACRWCRSS